MPETVARQRIQAAVRDLKTAQAGLARLERSTSVMKRRHLQARRANDQHRRLNGTNDPALHKVYLVFRQAYEAKARLVIPLGLNLKAHAAQVNDLVEWAAIEARTVLSPGLNGRRGLGTDMLDWSVWSTPATSELAA